MKKIIYTLLIVFTGFFANAQEAFSGKGDIKFQVGANIQDAGTGIAATTDFGIGENMSYGFTASYLLSTQKIGDDKAQFEDRIDLRARFSANLGKVINVDDKLDVYPGLDLGLRNFGAHLGARYFFSQGFGLYTEAGIPIARFNPENSMGYKRLNNQFHVNVGMTFNL